METILGPMIPLTFVLFLVLERVFPRERLPRVRGWLLKGIVFFAAAAVFNTVLPGAVAALTAGHSLVDLSGLGLAGALVVWVTTELVSYGLHRSFHRSHFLWRWVHQMHHSAERVDMAGFVYAHPFENVLAVGMATFVSAALGVTPAAAALGGFLGFLANAFTHLNVRTPRWVGYLVQRPEMHLIHHARGVHAHNYSALPFIDLLFGTFRNPATFASPAGFYDGASARLVAMLLGRDVGRPA